MKETVMTGLAKLGLATEAESCGATVCRLCVTAGCGFKHGATIEEGTWGVGGGNTGGGGNGAAGFDAEKRVMVVVLAKTNGVICPSIHLRVTGSSVLVGGL